MPVATGTRLSRNHTTKNQQRASILQSGSAEKLQEGIAAEVSLPPARGCQYAARAPATARKSRRQETGWDRRGWNGPRNNMLEQDDQVTAQAQGSSSRPADGPGLGGAKHPAAVAAAQHGILAAATDLRLGETAHGSANAHRDAGRPP